MKLFVQKAGQAVQEVPLSGSVNIDANAGTRLFVENNNANISHMSRSGSKLVINTTDGKVINVDNFFGSTENSLSSLTIDNAPNSGAPEKQIVLGDEKIYADGAEVTAYTPEQLKEIIAGNEYYEQRAAEAAAGGESDDNTGMFVALGLGAAAVAGLIALAVDDDNDGNGSRSNSSANPAPTNLTDPTMLVVDRSNGSSLTGISDQPNGTLYIDINGDGKSDHTAKIDANGKWSFNFPVALADGQVVTAWLMNNKGEKVTPVSITVDALPPESQSVVISQDLTTVTGKTEAGATVKLDVNGDGVAEYQVKADEKGNYKITLNGGTALIPGTSVISLADDLANTIKFKIPASSKVNILGMSDGQHAMDLSSTTVESSPTIHGLGKAGSVINILDGDKVVATTTVGADGQWKAKIDNLAAGAHNFGIQTLVPAPAIDSQKTVNVTFQGKPYNMAVMNADIRAIETNDTIDAPISITRALPNGGYLVAYPQAEVAGSKFYDIKVKIFDANGQVVSEMTLGEKGIADGYSGSSYQSFMSNFDVAVSPVDGAITVLYAKNESSNTYIGHDVVFQRFTANGTEITSGPQLVKSSNDVGGMNGALKEWLPDNIADAITNTLSGIVNPIADFMTTALKTVDFLNILPDTDFKAMVDLFVNGLTNRVYGALCGQGLLDSSIIQMEDGSVIFTGSSYRQLLDLEGLADRIDVSGFVKDFCDALGLKGIPIIGSLINSITAGVLGLIVQPIESLADTLLSFVDIDLLDGGSNLYSSRYETDAKGNLVKVSDNTETPHDILMGGFLSENGYISTNSGILDAVANIMFGTNPGSDSQGLAGADIGGGNYAVVWQQSCKDWSIDQLLNNPVDLKISVVDFKTGKIVIDGYTLNSGANGNTADVAPKIVTLADGSIAVAWTRISGTDKGDVMMQRFEMVGNKLQPIDAQPIRVNQQTEGAQGVLMNSLVGAMDLTVLENGNYVVTWASMATNGESHIVSRVYDITGNAVSGEIYADKGVNDAGTCSLPSVVALADGGFAVTWSEVSNTGSGNLYSRTYNGDGSFRAAGTPGDITAPGKFVEGTYQAANGTDGSDAIDGRHGVTNVTAGKGDDTVMVMKDKFTSIDGGDGFDTVMFADKDAIINSATLSKLKNIEQIDLNTTSANTLNLQYDDLIKLNGEKHLFVSGNSQDKVDLDLTNWSNVAAANKNGVEYNLYVYNKDEDAQVWVQNTVAVI
ncbi:Ig-like domain-containing protein [Budvicia diplopodorum]|uniref:Ig-like domain-containing protein n=1 Tax=Budvicia diplopodorum TaxID=1119056 RepID=UPI00135C01A8|nr:Ig-like domain-containing protein [Budvicia diplopodorum]